MDSKLDVIAVERCRVANSFVHQPYLLDYFKHSNRGVLVWLMVTVVISVNYFASDVIYDNCIVAVIIGFIVDVIVVIDPGVGAINRKVEVVTVDEMRGSKGKLLCN